MDGPRVLYLVFLPIPWMVLEYSTWSSSLSCEWSWSTPGLTPYPEDGPGVLNLVFLPPVDGPGVLNLVFLPPVDGPGVINLVFLPIL